MNTPHDDFSRALFWGNNEALHLYDHSAEHDSSEDLDEEYEEEPMDLALQLSVAVPDRGQGRRRIGGRTGGTVGGWGIFLDSHDPPRLAARVRERTPISLDPYVVDIVELPAGTDNYFDPGCWVLATRVVYAGDPTMRLDAASLSQDGKRVSIYMTVRGQSYTDESLRELMNDPEVCVDVVGPAAYRLDIGTSGSVGFALDPRETQPRIFGWLEPRSSGEPYVLRLLQFDGDGVLTAEQAARAKTLATATLVPPSLDSSETNEKTNEKQNEEEILLETTFEGRRYAFRATFGAFSQRAAAYMRF